MKILNEVKKCLYSIENVSSFKFIDFGCGEGKVLSTVSTIFKEIE